MELELVFTGLLAFVVGDGHQTGTRTCDLNADGASHNFQVVLFNGTPGMEHVPRLMADIDDLGSGTDQPDEILSVPGSDGTSRSIAAWDLTGWLVKLPIDLTVLPGSGSREKANGNPKWAATTPDELYNQDNDPRNFSWIADLQEACPGGGTLSHSCVCGLPGSGKCAVSRVDLTYSTGGKTNASLEPIWYKDQQNDVFHFGNTSRSYNQSLADGALISADNLATPSTITLNHDDKRHLCNGQPSGDDSKTKSIVIQSNVHKRVTVWISNDPKELEKKSSNGYRTAGHFEIYYHYLQHNPNPPNACQNPTDTTDEIPRFRTNQTIKCAICSTCDD